MNQLVLKKKNELMKKKKGFTLVELIIVIAIIAILAAMAIPKFSAVRIDAKVSNDVAAAKNIQSATQTLVSNGTITEALTKQSIPGDPGSVGEEIAKRVASNNGETTIGPEALSGAEFQVDVTADGDVTVFVKDTGESGVTYQLVPELKTGDNKSAYAKKAQ